MNSKLTLVSLALTAALTATASSAATLGNTEVGFSGYIKADAMLSRYNHGSLDSKSIGRDYYIPSLTPVGEDESSTQFDSHIQQSRFKFTTNTKLAEGHQLKGVFELDFLTTVAGDERVSNSFSPRIRHAYFQYNNWLVGQTFSTFFDTKVLPETLDFLGATDAVTFVRQPMLRYTNGNFEIALENSETTVTPFNSDQRLDCDESTLPDLTMRYTFKGDWGHVAVAGLARQLKVDKKLGEQDLSDSSGSYGVSVTAKFKLGDDDIRLMANGGTGLGRYLALNAANAAVLDADGQLEAIDSYALSASYRHLWNAKLRSTLVYSMFNADNDIALTGGKVTAKTESMRINLLYSPVANITVGAEYAHAMRELENGQQGDMDRLQFSAKYAF